MSTVSSQASLEEHIRHRYRQPKGIEQFGIEPIPEGKKTVGAFDIFSILLGLALNPGSILVGGLAVVSGLSFLGAVSAISIGMAIAVAAYTIMATVGVDYGLPGQVGTRMAYGVRGAKWFPSLIRTFASIYWFAFQSVAGSLALIAVLERLTGRLWHRTVPTCVLSQSRYPPLLTGDGQSALCIATGARRHCGL